MYHVLVPGISPECHFCSTCFSSIIKPKMLQQTLQQILPSLLSLETQHFILLTHPHLAPCSSLVSASPLCKLVVLLLCLHHLGPCPQSHLPAPTPASLLLHQQSLNIRMMSSLLPLAVKALPRVYHKLYQVMYSSSELHITSHSCPALPPRENCGVCVFVF